MKGTERTDEGGKKRETLMVMFFNWVDLWLAVTIILPFTPAGWRNQAGRLKPEGGERSTRDTGNLQKVGHNAARLLG